MTETNDKVAKLIKLVKTLAAEAAANRHAGAEHADLFAPLIADRLEVRTDADGRVRVVVLDAAGHARTKIAGGRLKPFEVGDLALELKSHPRLAPLFAEGAGKGTTAPALRKNMTEEMAAIAAAARQAAASPFTQEERAGFRQRNPWAKDTFNLTEQMAIIKRDPALASGLSAAAKTAGGESDVKYRHIQRQAQRDGKVVFGK